MQGIKHCKIWMINKRDIEKEVLAAIYINEIDNAWKILEKEFIKQDAKKEGIITIFQLRKVLK